MSNAQHQPQPLIWRHGCPYCGSPVAFGVPTCSACGFPLQDQRAAWVAQVDAAIAAGVPNHADLLVQRNAALAVHQPRWRTAPQAEAPAQPQARRQPEPQARRQPQPQPAGGRPQFPAPPAPPAPPASEPRPPRKRPELPLRDVQTTLLALGGILVSLAALIFAVVTWRHSSPGVRAGVLVGITTLAAIAPHYLARRKLRDTAQTFAALACSLLAVDVLLTRHLVAPGLDGRSFWAAATAVLAAGYFGYGRLSRMVSPYVFGIIAAQPSLLLASYRVSHTYGTAARFIVAVVILDGLLVWQLSRTATPGREARFTRLIAAVSGAGLWVIGLGYLATDINVRWNSPADVVADAACLLVYTAVAVAYGVRRPVDRRAAGAVAGLLGYVAVIVAGLSSTHAVVGLSIAAVLAVAAVGALLVAAGVPAQWRTGLLGAAGVGLAGAATTALSHVLGAMAMVVDGFPVLPLEGPQAAALVGIVVSTLTGILLLPTLLQRFPHWWPVAGAGAVAALAAAAPLLTPLSTFAAGLVALLAGASLVAAALASSELTTRRLSTWAIGLGLAVYAGFALRFDSAGLALAFTVIAVLAAASAVRGILRPAMTATGLAAAYGAVYAGWSTMTSPALPASIAAMIVPVLASAALVAIERSGRNAGGPSAQAAEVTAICVGSVSVMTTGINSGPGWLAWSLTVLGVATLAQSLRRGRASYAHAGLALLTFSSWIQLSLHDVRLIEAYTVPAAFIVLGIGFLRRHADSSVSSNEAYAGGLLLGLVPSLIVGLHEGPSTRAGLVLVAAALTALIGARSRLAAPLVIGACVALLDAIWLGAPTVASLPRWATLGLVGAVLLFVGATYEKRRTQVESVARQVRDLT